MFKLGNKHLKTHWAGFDGLVWCSQVCLWLEDWDVFGHNAVSLFAIPAVWCACLSARVCRPSLPLPLPSSLFLVMPIPFSVFWEYIHGKYTASDPKNTPYILVVSLFMVPLLPPSCFYLVFISDSQVRHFLHYLVLFILRVLTCVYSADGVWRQEHSSRWT